MEPQSARMTIKIDQCDPRQRRWDRGASSRDGRALMSGGCLSVWRLGAWLRAGAGARESNTVGTASLPNSRKRDQGVRLRARAGASARAARLQGPCLRRLHVPLTAVPYAPPGDRAAACAAARRPRRLRRRRHRPHLPGPEAGRMRAGQRGDRANVAGAPRPDALLTGESPENKILDNKSSRGQELKNKRLENKSF